MIRRFLKDESGFIGAILGPALGGLIGAGTGKALAVAVGGALGKAFDKKQADSKQAAYDANSYVRMSEAAQRAGLHPLEVLRAGDPGQSTGRMQFGTTAVMQNSFDQIESILTGDYAAEKRREEMRDELLRIDIEQAQRGVQTPIGIQSSSLSRVVQPSFVRTDQGPQAMSEISEPTPVNMFGDVDSEIDDGGAGVRLKPIDRVVTPSGTMDMTVGPDMDEALTGIAVDRATATMRAADTNALSEMAGRLYTGKFLRNMGDRPILWDDRFGVRPSGWDRMSNEEKMSYIIQSNRTPARRTPYFNNMGLR